MRKTVFILSLLEEGPYRVFFHHSVVLCPTIEHKTYKQCPWLWTDPETLDSGERLHDYLRAFYLVFKGEPTLYIIDDCAATKALTKKKDMLSELAFSGRRASGSSPRNTTQSWRTCASRRAGSHSSTARSATALKTACGWTTWYRQGNSGRWCGSS